MKKCSKIICMLLVMVAILSTTMVFAEGESGAYNILANVLNALLSALSWFGYAIAIGALVFMGIKYVMSGAQEKANLKGSLSKYLIGIALIVFCSTIASAVANIANTDGSNNAEGLIKRALGLGGATVGDPSATDTDPAGDVDDENSKDSNVKYYPTAVAPSPDDKLKSVLEKEGYYDNIETVGAPEFYKDGTTVKTRTSFAKDGKTITENYDENGKLTSVVVKENGKETKSAKLEYKDYDTVSSIQVTTEENGKKMLHTINSKKENGKVAMYSKQEITGNFMTGYEYTVIDMEIYRDKLPDNIKDYDELPESEDDTSPNCEKTGVHLPDSTGKICAICGATIKNPFLN